ncbi:hypothetical protein ACVWW3_008051 [Bradyrhizobium sp. LM2.9]
MTEACHLSIDEIGRSRRHASSQGIGMQDRLPSVLANGPDQPAGSSRAEILRAEICSRRELSFLMEVHDGLSAAIAERAGFKGLWASGLSIACSLGYRDANEASWSQLVDVVERIVESSGLPVLVDGDGGFGTFNNARLVARRLRQRGAAGVALEDSCFPKMNSFVGGSAPPRRHRRILWPPPRSEGYRGGRLDLGGKDRGVDRWA